jgi:hypothetical protein
MTSFTHGDCIGADTDAHNLIVSNKLINNDKIYKRPFNLTKQRSFTKEGINIAEPIAPLDRNKLIVDGTDILIAIPDTYKEVLRSGTWSTIRYAKLIKREFYIIYPDGKIINWKLGVFKDFIFPKEENQNEKYRSVCINVITRF